MKQIKVFRVAIMILFSLYSVSLFAREQPGIKTFKVEKVNSGVELKWKAGKNLFVNYFEVEKSINGRNFKTIGIVFGPDPM